MINKLENRTVSKTRHIQARMSHRGINQKMLKMARHYGVKHGDKYILNRKGLDTLIIELRELHKTAIKLRDKGGIVIIENELQEQITTYNLDSYKKTLH